MATWGHRETAIEFQASEFEENQIMEIFLPNSHESSFLLIKRQKCSNSKGLKMTELDLEEFPSVGDEI